MTQTPASGPLSLVTTPVMVPFSWTGAWPLTTTQPDVPSATSSPTASTPTNRRIILSSCRSPTLSHMLLVVPPGPSSPGTQAYDPTKSLHADRNLERMLAETLTPSPG